VQGDLQYFDGIYLLKRLSEEKATGILHAESEYGYAWFAYVQGKLVGAVVGPYGDALTNMLLWAGHITEYQREQYNALDLPARKLAARLVRGGVVQQNDLIDSLKKFIADILVEFSYWQSGPFFFEADRVIEPRFILPARIDSALERIQADRAAQQQQEEVEELPDWLREDQYETPYPFEEASPPQEVVSEPEPEEAHVEEPAATEQPVEEIPAWLEGAVEEPTQQNDELSQWLRSRVQTGELPPLEQLESDNGDEEEAYEEQPAPPERKRKGALTGWLTTVEPVKYEQVLFRAYYPRKLEGLDRFGLYVFAHTEEGFAEVHHYMREFSEELFQGSSLPGQQTSAQYIELAQSMEVTIVPQSTDMTFEPNWYVRQWNSPWTRFEFSFIPNRRKISGDIMVAQLSIQVGGSELTRIRFTWM